MEASSHFLWLHFAFWWVGRGKQVSLPGPTGEANFVDLIEFFFLFQGIRKHQGRDRLQKEPEERGLRGASLSKRGL